MELATRDLAKLLPVGHLISKFNWAKSGKGTVYWMAPKARCSRTGGEVYSRFCFCSNGNKDEFGETNSELTKYTRKSPSDPSSGNPAYSSSGDSNTKRNVEELTFWERVKYLGSGSFGNVFEASVMMDFSLLSKKFPCLTKETMPNHAYFRWSRRLHS